MPPDRKIVVITGAGSGIGRALAHEAARDGARIVLVGRRHSALEVTAAELPQGVADIFALDVSDVDGCRLLAAQIGAEYGRVDVLVNNAGKILVGPAEMDDPEEVAEMLSTNMLGPIRVTTTLLPLLRKSDAPRIVNVGSMLGDIAMPMFAAYAASKFGLRGWTDGLRRELANEGIGVTYAAPRATRTGASHAFDHLVEPFSMNVDSPEAVASKIWRAAAKGRRTMYPTGIETIGRVLQFLSPSLVDRTLSSQLTKVNMAGDV